MIRVDVFWSKPRGTNLNGLDMDGEHYCKKALECLSAAEQGRDPGGRFELLRIAQGFMRLAKHAAAWSDRETLTPNSELKPGIGAAQGVPAAV